MSFVLPNFLSFSNFSGIVRTLAQIVLQSHFSPFQNVPTSCKHSLMHNFIEGFEPTIMAKMKIINFEIINFSCVVSQNIRHSSEFIFEVLLA